MDLGRPYASVSNDMQLGHTQLFPSIPIKISLIVGVLAKRYIPADEVYVPCHSS